MVLLLAGPATAIQVRYAAVTGRILDAEAVPLVGYRVTFVGSLIGLAYGFVCGLTVGYFGAVIYNWIADLREKRGVGAPPHV